MGERGFVEIAPAVYVLRYPVLDVNATLVVGGEAAAVVDTLSTDDQARELLAAVRAVTALPLVVINSHHHFDHAFGNAVVAAPDGDIWAHEVAARILRDEMSFWQREWYEALLSTEPELAQGVAAVAVRPPNRTVHGEAGLDLGGRPLELRHLGRGHTDGDLLVAVPDAAVLIAGDLVEESGPPGFGDSFPMQWPQTLALVRQLITASTTVVPGHGDTVDDDFVRAQHDDLTELARLIREGHADGAAPEKVAARAPFGPEAALTAVRRGYAELAGRI
jgi:glyoxylase-like metal-dependent hydrolase (beta-lactamase superfamily II)